LIAFAQASSNSLSAFRERAMPNKADIKWFKEQFGATIQTAIAGTPLSLDMIVAIACQETGFIWSILRKKSLPLARVVALCVGDTIDFKPPNKGRKAFPKNRAELQSKPGGKEMFDIARAALVDMDAFIPGYKSAVANPNKFCHGYGVFQRDLQFYLNDPDYFLNKDYENFDRTLEHCLKELHRGLKLLDYEDRDTITHREFASVAIAYNTGGYKKSKGLKQGHNDGEKFYGERIMEYLELSAGVEAMAETVAETMADAMQPGRYVVSARNGLNLRGGPGTNFNPPIKLIATGTILQVVSQHSTDKNWALIDLEGDGLTDGFVFAPFLSKAN
jgi:hypothetical protein